MNLRHTAFEPYLYPVSLAAVSVIAVLSIIDLGVDIGEGAPLGHVVAESAVILAALTGALTLIRHLTRRVGRARGAAETLAQRLAASDRDRLRWRRAAQDLLQGLGVVMEQQFETWHLTAVEKEVALFLPQGLSHKEIAALRGISEATARQQARSVYRKAGLSGRRDLAAFFLEDIALPLQSSAPARGKMATRAAGIADDDRIAG